MRAITLALLSFSFAIAGCGREIPIRADIILTGGTIYVSEDKSQTVDAVAIGEGIILYVGEIDNALSLSRDGTQIISLRNKIAYPGLTGENTTLEQHRDADLRIYEIIETKEETSISEEHLVMTIDDGVVATITPADD